MTNNDKHIPVEPIVCRPRILATSGDEMTSMVTLSLVVKEESVTMETSTRAT